MKKIALGLFHFNPYWDLSPRSAHRHCTEALSPLLKALLAHPRWRLDIEIAGIGLEFIEAAYPADMEALRFLVERGQVELISSLYTPNLWLAFSGRDLKKSVELNRRCLDRLRLPWSRLFFSQEAFFGGGLRLLADDFDWMICKDDYLTYYHPVRAAAPCCTFDGMSILIASNHLLNELRLAMMRDPTFADRYGLLHNHRQHLLRDSELNEPEQFPYSRGQAGDLCWLWYHCGDGNHFGSMYKPDDLAHCYYDPVWSGMCLSHVQQYADDGYTLGTISDLVTSLDIRDSYELPYLLGGAWNPRRAEGAFRWMGSNDTQWEDDNIVLTSIAQARARLIAAEAANVNHDGIDALWATLLKAQISDGLGWHAGAHAVASALQSADSLLASASQLLPNIAGAPTPLGDLNNTLNLSSSSLVSIPEIDLFGAKGHGAYHSWTGNIHVYECEFENRDAFAGIRVLVDIDDLVFCPSGKETMPTSIPFHTLKQPKVSLPLSNGLLQIGNGLFIIKDTRTVHVAAIVECDRKVVTFAVRDYIAGRLYRWRFYIVSGDLSGAVDFANTINFCN